MFPLLHLSLCDELESFQTVSQANLSSLFYFFPLQYCGHRQVNETKRDGCYKCSESGNSHLEPVSDSTEKG